MTIKLTGGFLPMTGAASMGDFVSGVTVYTSAALEFTINNPTPASGDYFGWAVATDGNYAVISGLYVDDTAFNAGAIHIYDVATGALVRSLNNPTNSASNQFGNAVAISGNYAVIGAHTDDTGASNAGSAYIYDVTTGTLIHTINNPTPATNDFFGGSVAIDGNNAIIGCRNDDTGAADTGSAYIYDVTTGTLVHTINNPTPVTSDNFGNAVAISGNYAVIGCRNDDTGAGNAGSMYVYNVTTGALVHTINNPTPATSDQFGKSVAIHDNYIVTGAGGDDTGADNAGSAYVYDVTTGALLHTLNNPSPTVGDVLGEWLSISGNYAAITDRDGQGGGGPGLVYIFDVTNGTLVDTINNPTPANNDAFGKAIALSGSSVVIGAYGDNTGAADAGSAYIYKLT